MLSFPNAKINLGLHVIRRRDDGFHDIETVFYPVNLYDCLEILPSDNHVTSLKTYGNPIEVEDNLCLKAYWLLKEIYNIPAVDMHLLKHIPAGAGLGGGSSDAAHTLMMLNEMFRLNISPADLEMLAARLGSDCAFFIRNKPVFAQGRGEKFKNIELELSGKKVLIVKPDVHISTHEAYGMIRPQGGRTSPVRILNEPVDNWKHILKNDFEIPVFNKYPEIQRIRDELYEMGAVYASMSGSGSAVYGIFGEEVSALITRYPAKGKRHMSFLCRL